MIIERVESESIFQLKKNHDHIALSNRYVEWNYFWRDEKMSLSDIVDSMDIKCSLSSFDYIQNVYLMRNICRINDRTLRYWLDGYTDSISQSESF